MRIVHLSDIHLNKENMKDFQAFLLPALLDDLNKYNLNKEIDIILITGDLIDKGGESLGGVESALKTFQENVIEPIKNKFNLGYERFYFVPGNHDINEYADSKNIESGLTANLKDTNSINKFIDENTLEGIQRILPYKKFEDEYYKNNSNEKEITNFQSSYLINIGEIKVGINCLNTAWRCYDSKTDRGKILLGERQLTEAYNKIKECDIKIALMHHQPDWLADFDSIESILFKQYDLLLCGHVHKGSSWNTNKCHGDLFFSIAPINFAGNIRSNDRVYSNGYSILDYNPESGEIILNHRRYNHTNLQEYVKNTDVAEDGKETFTIKIKPSKKKILIRENSIQNQEMTVLNLGHSEVNYFKPNDILGEFMIEKNNFGTGFIKNKPIINESLKTISKYSSKYQNLINSLDLMSILIDKLLYKLSLDKADNKYINVIVDLNNNFDLINSSNNQEKISILELIYDSVIWFWGEISRDIIPELFNGEESITNLIKCIIDLQGKDCIEDQYIKVLMEAGETYTALESKNEYEIEKCSNSSLKCQIILCIVLPTYFYKEKLSSWASEVQIGEDNDEDVKQFLDVLKNEYLELQNVFIERDVNIDLFYNKILQNETTIIKGKKGSGKSSIIGKLIEKLSVEKYHTKFSLAIIIYSFKNSKNVSDLIHSIITQTNYILINKIDTSILSQIQTEYNIWGSSKANLNNINVIYKKIIREVLTNFIAEYGQIYIFIDSLELANESEDYIVNLFADLPNNGHIIFCVDDSNQGINGLISKQYCEDNTIMVDYLNKKEISNILNLPFTDTNNTEIIDRIYEKTKGNIKLIINLLEKAKMSGRDILEYLKENTGIDEENVKEYNKLANKWISFSDNMLEETLLFLAIFEKINFISLDKIQLFLKHKSYDIRLPKIKKFLNRVNEQIIYINDKIKLSDGELAKFVISSFFSKNDIEKFVADLFSWISECNEIGNTFVINFFKYLVKENLINKNELKNNFKIFIKKKRENNREEDLVDIGIYLCSDIKESVEYSLNMIEEAAEFNNSKAKAFLGYCFLVGENVQQDISKAEILLNEACDSGSTLAKLILGQILINGDYIMRDAEKGKKLLLEASSEGNKDAKLRLATILITGRGVKCNVIQGVELLNELIDENNATAMLYMGRIMIDGVSMEINVDKGLDLIKKAIELGNVEAKIELAERLIYGDGIEVDESEGFRILNEIVETGEIDAKRALARTSIIKGDMQLGCKLYEELINNKDLWAIQSYWELIISKKVSEDKRQVVLELINEQIQNNNIDAMRLLGESLIEGNGLERNVEEGIKLLEYCVSKADIDSIRVLGYKLANAIDIIQDKERGENLLLSIAERGDIDGKTLYALTLINNYSDEYNINRAIKLLEETSNYGDTYAKLNLSIILCIGKKIKKDIIRSIQLLEECIVRGNAQAARILGFKLLNGIDAPYDQKRAKELLIKAIEGNDILAKIILGEAIIMLKFPEYSVEYGLGMLEETAREEHMAEKVLGKLLIRGTSICKNKERGMDLLKSAAEKGNIEAKRELYDMYLDGRYVEQNIEKGKKYLMEALELNDEITKIYFAKRLLDGDCIEKNKIEGQRLFEDLVIKNNSDAMCEYGDRLICGNSLMMNKTKGEKLLRESIKLGNNNAKRILALSIIEGKLEDSNIDEAINLLEENVLESDETTMIVYGEMLLDGEKIKADLYRGIELLEVCCNRRNPIGQYYLGKRLVEGKKVKQDIKKGIDLLEKSIVTGGNENVSIFLAELYINGEYVPQDLERGVSILNNLASEGYESAQKILAKKLIKGDRIEKDTNKGVDFLTKLIKKGNTDAMIEYGEMLIDGFYLEKDLKRGQKLLEDAVKKENYNASYLLGRRMLSGITIKRHISHGLKHLNKAMKHGVAQARFEYGIMVKNGINVTANKNEGKGIIDEVLSKSSTEEKHYLGIIAYKLKDFELATQLFYDSYINEIDEASISLAYMFRRNEIRGKVELPDIHELLKIQIQNNNQSAKINLALYYIRKNNKYQYWDKVDEIFSNLDYCGAAAEWWYETARNGDLEGELVLGLIDRYGLIYGISEGVFIKRFNKVNNNGWNIPDWMFQDVIAFNEIAVTKAKEI